MEAAHGADAKARRPRRADAQRNRDAILLAARETFANEGVLASLDAIALRAGVGNATLYRNFPTRDDLLAAVIETSHDTALVEAKSWLASSTRVRRWRMTGEADLATAHLARPPVLRRDRSPGPGIIQNSACSPLLTQTAALLDAAKACGEAVSTVTADEVFELITALSWGVDRFGDDEHAAWRRVQVATAGLFV